jgi:hypothetical protein
MPRTLFRILAAALLALTIPIQGLAAVKAGVCMAMGAHDDHHRSAVAHAHGAYAHDHEESSSEGSHAGNGHCPPCVSCCAAAVIAPTTKVSLAEAAPFAAITAPQYWIAGVLPDNPERPPLAR